MPRFTAVQVLLFARGITFAAEFRFRSARYKTPLTQTSSTDMVQCRVRRTFASHFNFFFLVSY